MSDDKTNSVETGKCPMQNGTDGATIDFETIPANEVAEIEEIARVTTKLQEKRKDLPLQRGRVLRGVHAKAHGCVRAKFVVNQDIEEKYQIGLFAEPGASFDAHIRFSNSSVEIDEDSKFIKGDGTKPANWEHGSRGMAIKVYDVIGGVIDEDRDGQNNQDFLMINTPEFAFSDIHSYLFLTRALFESKFGNKPDNLLALGKITLEVIMKRRGATSPVPTQGDFDALRLFLASEHNKGNFKLPDTFALQDLQKVVATLILVVGKIQKQVVRNPLQVPYFGASPYLFGTNKVMKFSAAPSTLIKQEEFATIPPEMVNDHYLRDVLTQSVQEHSCITFDFKVIVREGDFGQDNELIEDATTTWKKESVEEVDQYVNVATILIEKNQDVTSDEAIHECENLIFTPWHSLVAHKPIGSINRMRRAVYQESAKYRQP